MVEPYSDPSLEQPAVVAAFVAPVVAALSFAAVELERRIADAAVVVVAAHIVAAADNQHYIAVVAVRRILLERTWCFYCRSNCCY